MKYHWNRYIAWDSNLIPVLISIRNSPSRTYTRFRLWQFWNGELTAFRARYFFWL